MLNQPAEPRHLRSSLPRGRMHPGTISGALSSISKSSSTRGGMYLPADTNIEKRETSPTDGGRFALNSTSNSHQTRANNCHGSLLWFSINQTPKPPLYRIVEQYYSANAFPEPLANVVLPPFVSVRQTDRKPQTIIRLNFPQPRKIDGLKTADAQSARVVHESSWPKWFDRGFVFIIVNYSLSFCRTE